jgi:hypothetical protein
MTSLFVANFPIAALFILAWVGIPLWMVLRRPDRRPDFAEARAYYHLKAELNRAEASTTRRPLPARARRRRPIGSLSAVLRARRRPAPAYAARTRQERHTQSTTH